MPPMNPFEGNPLSTATMKSICKWADRNKDGQLTTKELNAASNKLYATSYKDKNGSEINYASKYGVYIQCALKAAQNPYNAQHLKKGLFYINDIDVIASNDGNVKNLSYKDWMAYTKPTPYTAQNH